MKKITLCLLALCLALPAIALACSAYLPEDMANDYDNTIQVENGNTLLVITGKSSWAVVESCRELAGIKEPGEQLEILKVQNVSGNYIRGFAQGGLIRAKAMITVIPGAGCVLGLKELDNVIFKVPTQYVGLLAEIADRRIGDELSAATLAASTLWRRGDTVAHIFWRDEDNVFPVAEAWFNGGKDPQQMTYIWAGDFDGDGLLEIGFKFGVPYPTITKEPEATPEPTAEPTPEPTQAPEAKPETTPKPQEPAATPKPQCKQETKCEPKVQKVCWDFGIDISIWFKGCVSFVQGCMKALGK